MAERTTVGRVGNVAEAVTGELTAGTTGATVEAAAARGAVLTLVAAVAVRSAPAPAIPAVVSTITAVTSTGLRRSLIMYLQCGKDFICREGCACSGGFP